MLRQKQKVTKGLNLLDDSSKNATNFCYEGDMMPWDFTTTTYVMPVPKDEFKRPPPTLDELSTGTALRNNEVEFPTFNAV
jgi:hypothetical protein